MHSLLRIRPVRLLRRHARRTCHVHQAQAGERQARSAGGSIWPPAQHPLRRVVTRRRQQHSHIRPAEVRRGFILLNAIPCTRQQRGRSTPALLAARVVAGRTGRHEGCIACAAPTMHAVKVSALQQRQGPDIESHRQPRSGSLAQTAGARARSRPPCRSAASSTGCARLCGRPA